MRFAEVSSCVSRFYLELAVKTRRGFTLIELMIVVAIIAIIAAIAIPSILRSRISANQTSAMGSLVSILRMNTVFRENDEDRNGENDYWTEHVWGLHAVQDPDGNEITLISQGLADADYEGGDDDVTLSDASITDMTNGADGVISRSGYYYAMFTGRDAGSGGSTCTEDYNDADGGSEYTNDNQFAVQSFPVLYDKSGTKAFLVTEGGDVYEIDARVNVDGGSEKFNGGDGKPNGTIGSTPPVECVPTDGSLSEKWAVTD